MPGSEVGQEAMEGMDGLDKWLAACPSACCGPRAVSGAEGCT